MCHSRKVDGHPWQLIKRAKKNTVLLLTTRECLPCLQDIRRQREREL